MVYLQKLNKMKISLKQKKEIVKKNAKLEAVKLTLKTEFIGLDLVIDNIIDNIIIDGSYDGQSSVHTANNYGITIYSGANTTINQFQSFNNARQGLYM